MVGRVEVTGPSCAETRKETKISREALRCTRNVPHRGCGGACGRRGFHLPGPQNP